jgi:hypothetical protein
MFAGANSVDDFSEIIVWARAIVTSLARAATPPGGGVIF